MAVCLELTVDVKHYGISVKFYILTSDASYFSLSEFKMTNSSLNRQSFVGYLG